MSEARIVGRIRDWYHCADFNMSGEMVRETMELMIDVDHCDFARFPRGNVEIIIRERGHSER